MANLRQINFGGQGKQQIAQQQSPKSVLAQLLLRRAGKRDNTAGAGIRSAGENILGALLQKQAFEEQQDRLANQQANTADFIRSALKDTTKESPIGTDMQSLFKGSGGLQAFDRPTPDQLGLTRKPTDIVEGDVGPSLPQIQNTQFSGVDIGSGTAGPALAEAVRAFGAQGGAIDPNRLPLDIPPAVPPAITESVDSFDFQNPATPDFEGTGVGLTRATEQVTVPNENRELLLALNKATPGGADQSAVFNFIQQQQAQQGETFQVDLGDRIEVRNKQTNQLVSKFPKGVTPASKISAISAQLSRENQKLISDNTIASREQEGELNREAKAGERTKVNVLLGNDKKSGRPITQVGFAKKNDPSDIKFIGKPTVAGAGSQVNVSNLPQIPATMLNAITGAKLGIKQMGRIQSIINRLGVSNFGDLVGPWDNVIGGLMEKAGIPNKDQQSIKTITTDMTDLLGRLRSGGVISEQEWANFKLLVPQRGDNTQTFINKMGDFNNKMNDILSANLGSAQTFGFNTGTAQVGSNEDVTQMTDEQLRALGAK